MFLRNKFLDTHAATMYATLEVCLSLPDILKWDKVLVHKGLIDFGQDVHAFCHFPKHSMDSIQVVQVLTCSNEELRTRMTTD